MVLHSDLKPGDDGGRVLAHFERPTGEGFDSVRFELPSLKMIPWEGSYSEDELQGFRELLAANAHLLYEFASVLAGLRRGTKPKEFVPQT
ncbi:MAG: hypothetical protein IKG21_00495 [Atopobiaceae bacterium]|nr:hypothetical protein [Atopobiaceae bacterium]